MRSPTAARSPASATSNATPPSLETPPDTARAREAAAASAARDAPETRAQQLRRNAHQGRLQGYAVALVALVVVLVALAVTNTRAVRVDWLVGSSRVSLVWLVLATAILGWLLGALSSARFQWLTRAPRHRR